MLNNYTNESGRESCDVCSKTFKNKRRLLTHVKKFHGIDSLIVKNDETEEIIIKQEPGMRPLEPEMEPYEPEVDPYESEVTYLEPEMDSYEPEIRPLEPEIAIKEEVMEEFDLPEEQYSEADEIDPLMYYADLQSERLQV